MSPSKILPGLSVWGRRLLAILGALVILYAALGFLVVPALVKSKLPPTLSRMLGRPVSVANVRLNPFALSATVEGFAVKERDGADFLGFDRLYLRLGWASLFSRTLTVRDIELARPYGNVVVEPGGKLNFADITDRLARPGAGSSGGSGEGVWIGHLSVQDARIAFKDRSLAKPFATTVGPVSLDLTGFSTRRDTQSPYAFSGVTEAGESFRWNGTFELEPLSSRGSFEVGGLRLAKYQPYYQDRIAFRLADGVASAQAGYTFQWSQGVHIMKLLDGSLDLQGLKLSRPGQASPDVDLPRIEARGLQADLVARSVELASLDLRDGRITGNRAADGTISLVKLLTPIPDASPQPAAAPLRLALKELRLSGFRVAFQDLAPVRPVQVLAENLDLALTGFSLDPAAQAGLKLAMKLNGKAALTAEGTVSPLRPAADLKLKLDGLELAPFDAYLAPALDLRVNRGALSLDGRVTGVFQGRPDDTVSYKGSLRLDRFEAADGVRHEPFLGYKTLALSGMEVSTNPQVVLLKNVDLVEPDYRVVVAKDGSTNLGRALKLEQTPVQMPLGAIAATLPAAAGPPARLSILNSRMASGRLSFVDRSLEPNAALIITGLEGTATSLSTEPGTQSVVDFKGLAGGIAPLRIQGRAVPLRKDQDTDVTFTIQGSELSDFTPYAIKFLGYPVRKGKLDVDAHVRIQQRQLQALVKTRLDQLFLGDKTPSPDAVHLPVKLCLAIMRDRQGVIDLELPVDGSLDDPNLHYGKIIWHAVLNVLGKVVASPFTLLAHLGGTRDHDLSFVAFEPGSALPDAAAATKAQGLAKAMAERPELGLEVEGSADPSADAGALKKAGLEQELLELRNAAPDAAPVDAMPAEERPRWLRAAFLKAFPPADPSGAAPEPPPAEMEQQLLGAQPVTDDDLRALADRRAKAVLKLLRDLQVDPARLFETSGGQQAAKGGGSRVYFGLK